MTPGGWRKWLDSVGLYYPLLLAWHQAKNQWRLRQYRRQYPPIPEGALACNYCGHRFSRMVDWLPEPENRNALDKYQVLAGYGQHCICPGCLSTSRERLLLAAIERLFKPRGLHILHLAPEAKIYDSLSLENKVVAADLTPALYRHIAPDIVYADATALPFENDRFDMVWANHILEHIPNDQRAMREIFRVLKPGGTAVLQVPLGLGLHHTVENPSLATPAERSAAFGQNDHVRIYAKADYFLRLGEAGFRVVEYESSRFAPPGLSLQPGETLITGQKLPGSKNE